MQDRGPAAYVAEFIGVFALVFFITAAVSEFVYPPTAQNPPRVRSPCSTTKGSRAS